MKTAVSIPDRVFRKAERAAKRLGYSRSRLYARAIEEFVEAHSGNEITEAYDRICAKVDTRLDPGVAEMQWRSIPREEW